MSEQSHSCELWWGGKPDRRRDQDFDRGGSGAPNFTITRATGRAKVGARRTHATIYRGIKLLVVLINVLWMTGSLIDPKSSGKKKIMGLFFCMIFVVYLSRPLGIIQPNVYIVIELFFFSKSGFGSRVFMSPQTRATLSEKKSGARCNCCRSPHRHPPRV